MVCYLKDHGERFADLLAKKTTRGSERESRNRQRLQKLIARNKEVASYYNKIWLGPTAASRGFRPSLAKATIRGATG